MNNRNVFFRKSRLIKFPSPTGVNYYELTNEELLMRMTFKEFPSPTGVNYYELITRELLTEQQVEESFRPQQGLTIMNYRENDEGKQLLKIMFPSPTGVNYYESLPTKPR